jgi:hypothetical protein
VCEDTLARHVHDLGLLVHPLLSSNIRRAFAIGSIHPPQILATLPEGVTPKRDHHCGSAHIFVRRDGTALYLTNRTDKTLVALAIDAKGVPACLPACLPACVRVCVSVCVCVCVYSIIDCASYSALREPQASHSLC